jgi:FkbM family methyltransferase
MARHLTPTVAVDVDGVRFHLDTSDREVSRIVYIFGLYDRPLMHAAFAALERAGGRSDFGGGGLLDIGANIGTTTLTAVSAFGAGRGWAFEPDAENFRTLGVNLAANGLMERVRALQVALSDQAGEVAFERSEWNAGDHRVRTASGMERDAFGESAREVVTVPAQRLDELVELGDVDLSGVVLAWMDVQGHEGHVLDGARTLREAPIPIVTEYWPYGLAAAGGLDRFHDIVADGYPRMVDLGGPQGTPDLEDPRPTASLPSLAARHTGPDDHTDLLLLPPELG